MIAWPKATARGRVREGDVSAKLKLPPFYKVNGKLKSGLLKYYVKTIKNIISSSDIVPILFYLSPVRFSLINIFY